MDEKNKYTGMDILDLAQMAPESVFDEARKILETLVGYKELRMMYACALKEVRTKFEVLDVEFNVRYSRNPINAIHTRLKSNQSILEKMQRKEIPPEELEQQVEDIAGIRIICQFVEDIERVAQIISSRSDIEIKSEKDYIKHMKDSGYRSYHLIVFYTVQTLNGPKKLQVEIQIRTMAMDFWASLEHQIRYKNDVVVQPEIVEMLSACADRIAETDWEMMQLRDQIAAQGKGHR